MLKMDKNRAGMEFQCNECTANSEMAVPGSDQIIITKHVEMLQASRVCWVCTLCDTRNPILSPNTPPTLLP